MLHVLAWIGIILLGLFFAVSGVVMVVSPREYFRRIRWMAPGRGTMPEVGYGSRWRVIAMWTRIRGALLLAAMAWVAYQGYLKMR